MTAPLPPAPDAAPRAAPFQWQKPLVALTFLSLAAAIGLVLVSAAPAIARDLGWTSAHTVYRSSPKTESAGRAGAEALEEKERNLSEDDDDDALELGPRSGPGTRGLADLHLQEATVRKKTGVYPEPGSDPALVLEVGRSVYVMGERKGFLHIVFREFGHSVSGWVKESDLTVRPP